MSGKYEDYVQICNIDATQESFSSSVHTVDGKAVVFERGGPRFIVRKTVWRTLANFNLYRRTTGEQNAPSAIKLVKDFRFHCLYEYFSLTLAPSRIHSTFPDNGIVAMAMNSHLLAYLIEGTIFLFDFEKEALLPRTLQAPKKTVYGTQPCMVMDNERLFLYARITQKEDDAVLVFDIRKGTLLYSLNRHSDGTREDSAQPLQAAPLDKPALTVDWRRVLSRGAIDTTICVHDFS